MPVSGIKLDRILNIIIEVVNFIMLLLVVILLGAREYFLPFFWQNAIKLVEVEEKSHVNC